MSVEQLSEKQIFNIGRRIDSDAALDEFLSGVCPDDLEMRGRLKDLIHADRADSFLEKPPIALRETTQKNAAAEQEGQSIGPYKLLQEIGEGGMGVVYMAEQKTPVKRRVALKIIKPGMNTKQVMARFEAERQALAIMDHPNIARVYEAGATDSGLPYFVMELVKGTPITAYCDEHKLSAHERLKLFIDVCMAIQHAHQKGIIHRDLKPSNVLVAMFDNMPVVKVIDFGVAKATNQELTERTMFTQFGQIVGTLEYMSPEQARFNQLDIDTRSDVYSLGVLLYELLAGAPPFDRTRLHSAAFDEVMRIIREEDPPLPSTRLSTMGNDARTVSESRRTDVAGLGRLMRGDVDMIVMKALEKDRSRRYESASSFAADVRKYLSGDPIDARPPSTSYRLRRFAHRNKPAIAFSTLAFLLVLVAGGLLWQRHLAEKSAAVAKQRTDDYAQLFMSEIQSLALQGEFGKAEQLLAQAEDLKIRKSTQKLLKAEIELHKGEYASAIRLLNEIRSQPYDNSLTVDSMLSIAYQRAGLEEQHLELIQVIIEKECKTFSDYLYRGYALNNFFPVRAFQDLEQARKLDRTSHMAMLVYSESIAWIGENELDPRLALQGLEKGMKKLTAVAEYLPANQAVQNDLAIANYHCCLRSREQGLDSQADEYARKSEKLFNELPEAPSSFGSRSAYFLQTGQLERIKEDYARSQRLGLTHNHQAIAVAAALYKARDESAVDVLRATERMFSDSTAAMQVYARFDELKTEEDLRRLVVDSLQDREKVPLVLSVFDWTLYRLLNDKAGMLRSARGLRGLGHRTGVNSWVLHSDFMERKELSAEKVIRGSDDRFNLAYGHFYAAFDALAQKKRDVAKEHFRQLIATNKYETHGYMWALAFVERLDDPNWLPWLNGPNAVPES